MSEKVTLGGLLVAGSIFFVIIYELRTALDMIGVTLPLGPYLIGTIILIAIGGYIVWVYGAPGSPPVEAGDRKQNG